MELVRSHDLTIFVVTETRIQGEAAKRVISSLPFAGRSIVDPIGFSGELWMLWKLNAFILDIIKKDEQEIQAMVKVRHSNFSWLFSGIYASPKFSKRLFLSNNLIEVSDRLNLPWLLAGDFNEILRPIDKIGGRNINWNRAKFYNNCMDHYNLIDLGFSGPRHTWSNHREDGSLILIRIDRA
ncbi:reverse transcriptase [Quillaja saponaria]|uniref:Reverse transcriptase n=1 Tax=Quillaja saponaria TaxID=32244 RepID=A0AAD7KWZ3_QUISA|nr:reverse transcriptase [Quillaja saponaria]